MNGPDGPYREVTITVTATPDERGDYQAFCKADGEEWATVHSGTQHGAIDGILHYARVHLATPTMPFEELLLERRG